MGAAVGLQVEVKVGVGVRVGVRVGVGVLQLLPHQYCANQRSKVQLCAKLSCGVHLTNS